MKPEYTKWYLIKCIFQERCNKQDNWYISRFHRWRIIISCAWAVIRGNKLDFKQFNDATNRRNSMNYLDYSNNSIEIAVLWATGGSHIEYGSTMSWDSLWYPIKKTEGYKNSYFIESDGFP